MGAGNDLGDDRLAVGLDRLQLQASIVDQKPMPDLDGFENFLVRQLHARRIAQLRLVVERENIAGLELDLAVGKLANAQLGPLDVAKNADRAPDLLFDIANAADEIAHDLVARMAHIDAEQVCTRLVELSDHGLVGGGRTEGRQDFDFALASHWLVPSVLSGVALGAVVGDSGGAGVSES
ncbi:hypothetical protein RHIZ404_200468 [Rhizobium sp. EC-SD404]|nr:hypothetical protein RHIZ404_200468 [Rhizobium sp. EC-SD404]